MQRVIALSVLVVLTAALAHSQAKTKAHARTTTVSTSKKPAATTKTAGHARTRTVKGKKARSKPAPSYQLHPDAERYRQIQQALAEKGYFKGQVNGQWDGDSVDALKRFQTDKKIDPDGKINSLSLIGLGLGPKHDGTSGRIGAVPPPAPVTELSPQSAETQSSTTVPPQQP